MSSIYSKHKDVMLRIMKLGIDQNKPHLRRFATLHQEEQGELEQIALTDPDHTIRYDAIGKITNHEILQLVVERDTEFTNKILAVECIEDRKTLLVLRLISEPELQPIIQARIKQLLE